FAANGVPAIKLRDHALAVHLHDHGVPLAEFARSVEVRHGLRSGLGSLNSDRVRLQEKMTDPTRLVTENQLNGVGAIQPDREFKDRIVICEPVTPTRRRRSPGEVSIE